MKALGVILVLLGIIGLFAGGISYTRREEILDVGPIEATVEKRERIPLPPIAGAIALSCGIVLLMRRRGRVA